MNRPGTPKNGGADYSPLPSVRGLDTDADLYPMSPTSPASRGGYQDFHPDNVAPYTAEPDNRGGPSSSYVNVASSTPYSSSPHLPSGAAQPRFLGSALYQDMPGGRNSFASSQHTLNSGNFDANSSVYGLQSDPMGEQGYFGQVPDHGASFAGSTQALRMPGGSQPRYVSDKRSMYASPATKSKRKLLLWAGVGVLVLVAAAVGLGFILRPKSSNKTSSPAQTSSGAPKATGTATPTSAVTGGDGSLITFEDGTTYTYSNPFGGYWYYDINDPFNNAARPQSWVPALNETFNYGVDQIRG
jgi:glucan 1,3-beta-glucosidase